MQFDKNERENIRSPGEEVLPKKPVQRITKPDPEVFDKEFEWEHHPGEMSEGQPILGNNVRSFLAMYDSNEMQVALGEMFQWIVRHTKGIADPVTFNQQRDKLATQMAKTFVGKLTLPVDTLLPGGGSLDKDKLNHAQKDFFLYLEFALKEKANHARKPPKREATFHGRRI